MNLSYNCISKYQKFMQLGITDVTSTFCHRNKPLLIVHGDTGERKSVLETEASAFENVQLFQVSGFVFCICDTKYASHLATAA